MIQRFLLDTNIISEPIKKDPSKLITDRLSAYGHFCVISAVTWHEIIYGIEKLSPSKKKEKMKAYLEQVIAPTFPIMPYDTLASEIHGKIRAAREAMGNTLPFADGQIASIALANDLILITRNVEDFSGITDLIVENWFE